jgi:hypothetical protein
MLPDEIGPVFEIEFAAGSATVNEIPIVYDDVTTYTRDGIRFVNDAVTAKGGKHLTDHVVVLSSLCLLLSERAFRLLQSQRTCPRIEWRPIQRTWRRSAHSYWAGDTMLGHDIWDYDVSDYTLLRPNDPRSRTNVGTLRRGVASRNAIPQLELFKSTHGQWIGSASLKAAWEQAGLTGTEVRPVQFAP